MSAPAPYVGITDFMEYGQVERMLKVFNRHVQQGSKRQLHVGVMMSYKTLHDIPNRWDDAFPKKEDIWRIFSSLDTMNCLHYADYRQDPFIINDLCKAIYWGGVGMTTLQLDMIWPQPDQVAEAVQRSGKQLDVILQIGENAFDQVENDPEQLGARLGEYFDLINYVLLDKSMGNGRTMSAEFLGPFISYIKKYFPKLGIGVAGGLGPDRMEPVKPLLEMYQDLSIDAQSWLRPSGNALDPVDWYTAEAYLIQALGMFTV